MSLQRVPCNDSWNLHTWGAYNSRRVKIQLHHLHPVPTKSAPTPALLPVIPKLHEESGIARPGTRCAMHVGIWLCQIRKHEFLTIKNLIDYHYVDWSRIISIIIWEFISLIGVGLHGFGLNNLTPLDWTGWPVNILWWMMPCLGWGSLLKKIQGGFYVQPWKIFVIIYMTQEVVGTYWKTNNNNVASYIENMYVTKHEKTGLMYIIATRTRFLEDQTATHITSR